MAVNISRVPVREQNPSVRRKNFDEVSYGYNEQEALLEASRCLNCKNPACVAACPVSVKIPLFIKEIAAGDFRQAAAVIAADSSLPAVCGRVCPQESQCEGACIRGVKSEPVAIGKLERFVADWSREHGVNFTEKARSNGIKIAVIGSGPSGLACAADLAKAGYDVTVFEALHKPGGVLQYGIPEFRLPKESVVAHEIENLKSMGVKIETNVIIGKTVTVDQLMEEEGFKAIFIGQGAGLPKFMNIPGENLNGVFSANEFLTRNNLMQAYREDADTPIYAGRKAIVVGGGNVAMDAARMAKRIPGVESVSVIYRRTESEMPADYEEYEAAIADGISFQFLSSPSTFTDGKLTVKLMELGEQDSSGRRRPVDTGRTAEYDIDYVISAIGEKADQDVLKAIASGEGEEDGVFIIGDASTGPSTVVRCIASARDAVDKAIDMVYKAIEEEDEDEDECECGHHHGDDCDCHHHDDECDCHHDDEEDDEEENDADLRLAEDRFFQNIAEKKSRLKPSVSVNDEFFARTEAKRCMECSYLCLKCVDVCPNRANIGIDLRETGLFEDPYQVLHIDAYCNECGNCATFCPHSGRPYKDKFTLFSLPEDFDNSDNSGFIADGNLVKIRLDGKIIEGEIGRDGELEADVPEEIKAIIEEIFLSYSYLLSPVEE